MAGLDVKGIVYEYETERISFTQPEKKRSYIPDIILTKMLGDKMYIELKGKFDRDAQQKMVLVKSEHPELDIRLVFMRDNRMSKNTKTKTYSDWARQKGFPFAVGHIPDGWLEE